MNAALSRIARGETHEETVRAGAWVDYIYVLYLL